MNLKAASAVVAIVGCLIAGAGVAHVALIPFLRKRKNALIEKDARLMNLLNPMLKDLSKEQKIFFWEQPRVDEVIDNWQAGLYTQEQFEQAIQFVIDHYLNK